MGEEIEILKECTFCRLADELNTEEIPFWSKKSGNYSPYPKMVSCEERYSLQNPDLTEYDPDLTDNPIKIKLSLSPDNKNKWVFCWAPNPSTDCFSINHPETAYGEYENHALKQCDEKGDVTLQLNCPQPYKDEKQTYCRHIHYILEGSDKTWLPLKTIRIICTIDIQDLHKICKSKDTMIINALPEKYFRKEKIPNSVNLYYKSLDKLTQKSKERNVLKFLRANVKQYPELNNRVLNKSLDIKDIPIIVYCANSKCDASEQLIDHLYECKVNNVMEFKEGMEGWNKGITFFDDSKEKDDDEEKEKDDDEEDDEEKEKDDDEEDDEEKKEDDDDDSDDDDSDDDDSDDDSEDDEDEDEDDSDDDELTEITHEGVEYSFKDGTLYDEYLDPIGKVVVEDGKIIHFDDKSKKYHDLHKVIPEKEETTDKLDKAKISAKEKTDEKQKGDKEQDEEEKEEEKEDEDEDEDEDEGEDEEGKEDGDEGGDKWPYTRHALKNKSKNDLKEVVKELTSREKSSYTFDDLKGKSKSELVNIVTICQGKVFRKSMKTDYKFPTSDKINKMKDTELRELINEMTGREPGTYKLCESSWSVDRLTDYILTCQGIPKPRKKTKGSLFTGGGWSL